MAKWFIDKQHDSSISGLSQAGDFCHMPGLYPFSSFPVCLCAVCHRMKRMDPAKKKSI